MRRNNIQKNALSFRTLAVVFTALLIIAGVLIGSSLSEGYHSDASMEEPVYKYYTSIEITEGDTLSSIADEYINLQYQDKDSYMEEIIQLNKIDADSIHCGQYLLIPYYSNELL